MHDWPGARAVFLVLPVGAVLMLGEDGDYVIEEKAYRQYVS